MASTNSDNVANIATEISELSNSVKQMDVAGDNQDKKDVRKHF
jgi:hypothetical protein